MGFAWANPLYIKGGIIVKYTDNAKKAMSLANRCSSRLNHRYIGTEHLLYGLLREKNGVAAIVLQDLGVDDHKLLEIGRASCRERV